MKLIISLILPALIATTGARAATILDSVQPAIGNLISKSIDERATARDSIQKQFDDSTNAQQRAAVDELLAKLSSDDATTRQTSAIALSKLKAPWQATNHDAAVKDLCAMFMKAPDQTQKKYLDDAFANAKGLYLDAINDFNSDRVDNPDSVAAKFSRIPTDCPKSRYAANSAYYLGHYWTRVALIKSPADPTAIARYVLKSDDAFKNFIQRAGRGDFATADFITDAGYFLAMNRILAGDENAAIPMLTAISTSPAKNKNIYVYQLFYKTGDRSTVVDRYIAAEQLCLKTIDFIKANSGALPVAQSKLVTVLLEGK